MEEREPPVQGLHSPHAAADGRAGRGTWRPRGQAVPVAGGGGRPLRDARGGEPRQRAAFAPPRGRFFDRFGVALASNRLNWRALLIAEQTPDLGATLDAFGRIVPLPEHERARIEREVHRHRAFIPTVVREFLTWDEMAKIEVNAPDLPGILIDAGTTRLYPFGEQLAHVVGYVAPPSEDDMGGDPMLALPGIRVGRAGVEKFYEPICAGARVSCSLRSMRLGG